MKKTVFAIALALVLAAGCVCFAEVDTTNWSRNSFEGSNVTMLIPDDFTLQDTPEAELSADDYYYEGNANLILEVKQYEGEAATTEEIAQEYGSQDIIASAETANIGGVDMVVFEGADDDVCGFITVSPEGTIYHFLFYPITNEDYTGDENTGLETAKAMINSVEAEG